MKLALVGEGVRSRAPGERRASDPLLLALGLLLGVGPVGALVGLDVLGAALRDADSVEPCRCGCGG